MGYHGPMENKENPIDALPQDTAAAPPERPRNDEDRRFGREIAYGIQQTLACWATDFIDPPISKFIQNMRGNKAHAVTNVHVYGGEAIGDTAALGIYLVAKRMFQKPIDGVIAGVKRVADPILSKMGKGAIKSWAEAHHTAEGDDRYKKKLDEYKAYQAENLVDTSIISVAATGVNVLAQRQLGNQQSYGTILGSKMVGALLTFGVMFGLRAALPNATKALDDELSDRYFSKVIRAAKKGLGVRDEAPADLLAPEPAAVAKNDTIGLPYALSKEKRDGLISLTAEHAAKIDMSDPQAFTQMIAGQKKVYQALLKALDAEGYLASVMAREHYEVMEKTYRHTFDHSDTAARALDREASEASVQHNLADKRRDLQTFLTLLDDPNFIADVKKAVDTKSIPEVKNKVISEHEKKELSNALLAKANGKGDLTQAIFDKAEAQVVAYKAIAHSMEPEGIVTRVLASEMKKLMPDFDPKDIDGIAKDYMGYYNREALSLAAEFKTDSKTVQHAVERSQKLRGKFQPPAETSYAMAT